VEGWLHIETARKIFMQAGKNFEELKASACKQGFKPVPLDLKVEINVKNSFERLKSKNVIALFPGKERQDEYIIYTAHWDHLGINPTLEGDKIFNGALDNATGTAGLIELAEAFTKLKSPPLRSIIFLAVTCEEQGLLGSEYYATHPIYPLTKTVAVINMDALNIYGKMKDITLVGYGNSELDDYVKTIAAEQGRVVRPDPTPEKGTFYRSDHFSFAKQGLPVLYPRPGINHIKYGEKWTLAKIEEYIRKKYHKPSDEYDPKWDLSGAIDDLRLLFKVGYKLAMESTFPKWKKGSELKKIKT
jgi:Zn-dependent M28 family amino/carboxypeptidase